jgi:hypothetical protein
MIPATGSFFAHYDGVDAQPRKVIAWSDKGSPMVLGDGGLVTAQTFPGFNRVIRRGDLAPAVAALPGGGWMVDTLWEDGDVTATPVLLWAVHSDGTATPMDTDHNGETSSALHSGERHYVYHPDHDNPEARKQAGFPPHAAQESGEG